MYKITLELADNGVIKTIVDDNSNGGGQQSETKIVYDLGSDPDFSKTTNFLLDTCYDLGLSLVNRDSNIQLEFKTSNVDNSNVPLDELELELLECKYQAKSIQLEINRRKNK